LLHRIAVLFLGVRFPWVKTTGLKAMRFSKDQTKSLRDKNEQTLRNILSYNITSIMDKKLE
jgi:hypothetical protein